MQSQIGIAYTSTHHSIDAKAGLSSPSRKRRHSARRLPLR
jgi:hypothetical protein